MIIIFQMAVDAETRSKRRRQQAAPCRCAYKGERRQRQLNASRSGAFVYHYVNAVILHRRIEIFLHYGTQTVDLVDKQNVVLLQRGQDSGQIVRFVENRSGGNLEPYTELIGYDARECRFPESGRAMEQQVVQCLATHTRRGDKHFQVLYNLVLSAERIEFRRAQSLFDLALPFRKTRGLAHVAYVK